VTASGRAIAAEDAEIWMNVSISLIAGSRPRGGDHKYYAFDSVGTRPKQVALCVGNSKRKKHFKRPRG
jgi:hypothetical protein